MVKKIKLILCGLVLAIILTISLGVYVSSDEPKKSSKWTADEVWDWTMLNRWAKKEGYKWGL